MVDVQPAIGDRVTFIDSEGDRHRALVVDECRDAPYITVVTGVNGQLGETYNHGTDDHSSVFPHTSISDDPQATKTTAFIPGWTAANDETPIDVTA